VNLAQRLQDLARPAGTTVITRSTMEATGGLIDAVELPALRVKGRTTPVDAYRIDHHGSVGAPDNHQQKDPT